VSYTSPAAADRPLAAFGALDAPVSDVAGDSVGVGAAGRVRAGGAGDREGTDRRGRTARGRGTPPRGRRGTPPPRPWRPPPRVAAPGGRIP